MVETTAQAVATATQVLTTPKPQYFDEPILLNPEDALACSDRGLAYDGLGKSKEVDRDFAKAKELG
jgi:Flp pilus assembly protein TadD